MPFVLLTPPRLLASYNDRDLSQNELEGSLPLSIAQLSHLERLYVPPVDPLSFLQPLPLSDLLPSAISKETLSPALFLIL